MSDVYVPDWLRRTIKRAKEEQAKLPPEYRIITQVSKPKCEPRLGGPHDMYIIGYWHVDGCDCKSKL